MSRYHLELTENERLLLVFCLGAVHDRAAVVCDQMDPPAVPIELALRLVSMNPGPTNPIATAPAGQPVVNEPRVPADPKPAENVIEVACTPIGVQKTGVGDKERVVVQWRQGRDQKIASCWVKQKALWPRLLGSVNKSITLLVREKDRYLSIIGVKA